MARGLCDWGPYISTNLHNWAFKSHFFADFSCSLILTTEPLRRIIIITLLTCFDLCRKHGLPSLSSQRKTIMLLWVCLWWGFLAEVTATLLLVRQASAAQPRLAHTGTVLPSPTLYRAREKQWWRDPVWWESAVLKGDCRVHMKSSANRKTDG